MVMKNTGTVYNTALGSFDSSKGDFRLLNVTAGSGGKSYLNFLKISSHIEEFCQQVNKRKITHTSLSTIKRRLKKMADKVEYVGSGYSGYWKIKE